MFIVFGLLTDKDNKQKAEWGKIWRDSTFSGVLAQWGAYGAAHSLF